VRWISGVAMAILELFLALFRPWILVVVNDLDKWIGARFDRNSPMTEAKIMRVNVILAVFQSASLLKMCLDERPKIDDKIIKTQ
jgi:hypothetical protein